MYVKALPATRAAAAMSNWTLVVKCRDLHFERASASAVRQPALSERLSHLSLDVDLRIGSRGSCQPRYTFSWRTPNNSLKFSRPNAIGSMTSSHFFLADNGKRTKTPTVSRSDPAHG